MGNTCKPTAVSFQCRTKFTTNNNNNNNNKIKIKLGINSKKINLQRGSIQTALYSVRFFMLSLMSVMSVYFTVHITGSFLSLLNEVESFSRV